MAMHIKSKKLEQVKTAVPGFGDVPSRGDIEERKRKERRRTACTTANTSRLKLKLKAKPNTQNLSQSTKQRIIVLFGLLLLL